MDLLATLILITCFAALLWLALAKLGKKPVDQRPEGDWPHVPVELSLHHGKGNSDV